MRIPRWTYVLAVLAIAVAHTLLYLLLFGWAFTAGEAGNGKPILGTAVLVLGTPLMHFLWLGPEVFGPWGPWWGDDSNFIIGLAMLNGLVWGLAATWAVKRILSRKANAA